MSEVKCPICKKDHDEAFACPTCSFEFHQTFSISKRFQEIEQKRIAAHTEWWLNLQANNVDRHEYIAKISELEHITEKCKELLAKNDELKTQNTNLEKAVLHLNNKLEDNEKLIKHLQEQIKQLEDERPSSPVENTMPYGYIIVQQCDRYSQILPFYNTTNLVGRNPQGTEVNKCKIITSCRELNDEHFQLTVTQDEKVMGILMDGCQWNILGQGNQITECELSNGDIITIGNLSLIIILM